MSRIFDCKTCGEHFYYEDEVVGLNINGEQVPVDEQSLESNVQNPDYLVAVVCNDCYENSPHLLLE